MAIDPALLLERMAVTLRHDVGPQVADDFARTQAFMASVILAKLAGQLRTATADAAAADVEHGAVARALGAAVGDGPAEVRAAVEALAADGATARWNDVVTALYAARDDLDRFDEALGIVRGALRARLDRALRYAR